MFMAKSSVRYGAELRRRAEAVQKSKRAKYACFKCGKKNVKRISYAQWRCRSCNAKFAGGAYSLSTTVGETGRRIIQDLKRNA
ncbi:50S ribosomal protein L37ae [Candidatus Micrarchaeota archaeon]|nr:50S ribosomal protein L37ae [Candidatus Micrarchaeota archaeon]